MSLLARGRAALTGDRQRITVAELSKGALESFELDVPFVSLMDDVLDAVEMDVAFDLGRNSSAQFTRHAIEGDPGLPAVTDHVINDPDQFSLSVLLWDNSSPLGAFSAFSRSVAEKIEALQRWKRQGTRLVIFGYGQEEIQSVGITSISDPTNVQTGIYSRMLSLSFERLVVASAEAREVTIAQSGRPGGGRGSVASSPTTPQGPAAVRVSTLRSISGGGG